MLRPPGGRRRAARMLTVAISTPVAVWRLKPSTSVDGIIDGDRYLLSPRIQTLGVIRAKLRPDPVREPRRLHRSNM